MDPHMATDMVALTMDPHMATHMATDMVAPTMDPHMGPMAGYGIHGMDEDQMNKACTNKPDDTYCMDGPHAICTTCNRIYHWTEYDDDQCVTCIYERNYQDNLSIIISLLCIHDPITITSTNCCQQLIRLLFVHNEYLICIDIVVRHEQICILIGMDIYPLQLSYDNTIQDLLTAISHLNQPIIPYQFINSRICLDPEHLQTTLFDASIDNLQINVIHTPL
jgi:hypothetical protein